MRRFLIHVALIVMMIGPLYHAHAESHAPYYFGAAYGIANYTGEEINDNLLVAGQKLEESSGYAEAFAGLDIAENLSVELGYAVFDEVHDSYISLEIPSIVSPNNEETVDYSRIRLQMVYRIPLGNRFRMLLSGGYAYYDFDRKLWGGFSPTTPDFSVNLDESLHGLEVGIGGEFNLTKQLFVRGTISHSLLQDHSVQSNSVSMIYRF